MNDQQVVSKLKEAVRYYNDKAFDMAVAILREILAADPNHPRPIARYNLAKILGEIDAKTHVQEQKTLLEAVLQAPPNPCQTLAKGELQKIYDIDTDYHYQLALQCFQKKDYGSAIESVKHAFTISLKTASLHNLLGKIYFAMREHDRAIAQFELANELEPDNVTYLTHLGAALGESLQLDKAKHIFEKAQRLSPNDPLLQNNVKHLEKLSQAQLNQQNANTHLTSDPAGDVIENEKSNAWPMTYSLEELPEILH